MNVQTYLKYNNIALVDPQVAFHSSCIAQFNEKGYLSSKQLEHLRSWSHSQEAIARLTADIGSCHTPVVTVPTPAINKGRWSKDELTALFDTVTSSPEKLTLAELAGKFNRTEAAVQGTLYKHGECAVKKGKVVYYEVNTDLDEIPF